MHTAKQQEVDLAWPGVKVFTMHAAKGLEFMVKAVMGLGKAACQ